MRKYWWLISLILLVGASCVMYVPSGEGGYSSPGGPSSRSPQESFSDVDTSYFYQYLSPYGDWVNYSPYGYCWVPRHMGYRWRPYTHGHWFWTDYGWTWDSDYEWGWIPFHYGRWGWDDDIGWYWVPGATWGPSWVCWRSSDLYLGWAPLPPGVEFEAGMGISSLPFDIPGNYWVFIEGRYFAEPGIADYVLPFERSITIINYTQIHNRIYVRNDRVINEGIGVDEVRRITHRTISRYELRDAPRPGLARVEGGAVQLYRPKIRRNEAAKPQVYLNKDEAREKLAPVKIWEPLRQRMPKEEESAVRERQIQEQKLLEKSQTVEINDLRRKVSQQEKQVRNPVEKEKVKKDNEAKVSELKKSHEVEKQNLKARQKKDEEQVKKKKIKKD